MYKLLVRPFLFLFDAEQVHHFTFKTIKLINQIPGVSLIIRSIYTIEDKKLEREVFGLTFKNPVGLAAGFDKDAKLHSELANFGFGFIEVGTVTPKPQAGNPKKRLFRLKQDSAIINRMGFNNAGVEALVNRLKKNQKKLQQKKVLVGGNIGKNKTTPNNEAVKDYIYCFNALYNYVDYFVVNVSSPNTPGLRELQEKEPLTKILNTLQQENAIKAQQLQVKPKPILLKIAPDLTNSQLLDIIEIVKTTNIAGLIATNTTLNREGLISDNKNEIGGLSGKPLAKRSTEVIKFLHENSKGAFPIIGVGGIHDVNDAKEKIKAGATLIQLYTGFIYEGPSLVKKINKALLN